jgi:hypothetical protein
MAKKYHTRKAQRSPAPIVRFQLVFSGRNWL